MTTKKQRPMENHERITVDTKTGPVEVMSIKALRTPDTYPTPMIVNKGGISNSTLEATYNLQVEVDICDLRDGTKDCYYKLWKTGHNYSLLLERIDGASGQPRKHGNPIVAVKEAATKLLKDYTGEHSLNGISIQARAAEHGMISKYAKILAEASFSADYLLEHFEDTNA